MRTIEVPDELLDLLKGSRLAGRSEADQVRSALAIHLFQEGIISIGKAAALAGVPRVEFEWLLVEMGIPVVRYDLADYEVDQRGISAAEQRETS
jgi:predicted HTH domain antitoxin